MFREAIQKNIIGTFHRPRTRTGARDRETHHWHHRGQQKKHCLVSETVLCSAKRKLGLSYGYFCIHCRYSRLHFV